MLFTALSITNRVKFNLFSDNNTAVDTSVRHRLALPCVEPVGFRSSHHHHCYRIPKTVATILLQLDNQYLASSLCLSFSVLVSDMPQGNGRSRDTFTLSFTSLPSHTPQAHAEDCCTVLAFLWGNWLVGATIALVFLQLLCFVHISKGVCTRSSGVVAFDQNALKWPLTYIRKCHD